MATVLRVLLVEDMDLIREVLRRHLVALPEVAVVGEAADGLAAVEVIRSTQPDCVLLDLELPGLDGFEVIAAIQPTMPAVKFLIMSGYCNQRVVQRARKAGVAGFIDKFGCGLDTLRTALNAVADGRAYFSDRFREIIASFGTKACVFAPVLTKREQEILGYIAGANSNDTIARNLGLSVKTVSTHRNNILRKLSISNTPHLVFYAMTNGFKPLRLPRVRKTSKRQY